MTDVERWDAFVELQVQNQSSSDVAIFLECANKSRQRIVTGEISYREALLELIAAAKKELDRRIQSN